jgi:hypothetical protein
MSFLVVLAVLFLVIVFVSAPLRHARRPDTGRGTELAELEAARDAKYREIRDAELDHRTGKLSESDYAALDSALRGEAIEILHRIDGLREGATEPAPASAP